MKYFLLLFLVLCNQSYAANSVSQSSTSVEHCLIPTKTCFIPFNGALYTQYHRSYYSNTQGNTCPSFFAFEATYTYQNTTNGPLIGSYLFGQNPISVKGSALTDQGNASIDPTNSWMAEYLGMGPENNFSFFLSPSITNHTINFKVSMQGKHAWTQLNLPLTRTVWALNGGGAPTTCGTIATGPLQLEERCFIGVSGESNDKGKICQPTAVNAKGIPNKWSPVSLASFNSYFREKTHGSDIKETFQKATDANGEVTELIGFGEWQEGVAEVQTLTPTNEGIVNISSGTPIFISTTTPASGTEMFLIGQDPADAITSLTEALFLPKFADVEEGRYNKCNFSPCPSWNISEAQIQFGYDLFVSEHHHGGMYLRATLPIEGGTTPEWAHYLFSPLVGNGGHCTLGLGITGHETLWHCHEQSLTAFIDAYATHGFSRQQFRTFDRLPADRYAIVKELSYHPGLGDAGNGNCDGSDFSYYNVMRRFGDITARYLSTSIGIQGEGVIDLVYQCRHWHFGIGYSFSGQSEEEIDLSTTSSTITESISAGAIPPGARYYGYKANATINGLGIQYAPQDMTTTMTLFEKAYNATTSNSGPFYVGTTSWVTNNGRGGISWAENTEPSNPENVNEEHTTFNDVFTADDVNFSSGLMDKQINNKLFFHLDYTMEECRGQPNVSIFCAYRFTTPSYFTTAGADLGVRIGLVF